MSNDKSFVCRDCEKDIGYIRHKDGTGYFDTDGYLVGFKGDVCDECYAKDSEIK